MSIPETGAFFPPHYFHEICTQTNKKSAGFEDEYGDLDGYYSQRIRRQRKTVAVIKHTPKTILTRSFVYNTLLRTAEATFPR
jgi:hypothetical protein